MRCYRHRIRLPSCSRGLHEITRHVREALPELEDVAIGLLHLFLQHTSASLTINENADPDVPIDLDSAIDRLAPEEAPYRHTCEGPDDMPAHIKASLFGCSLTLPVEDGHFCLGTWQGIYLAEHRDRARSRQLIMTLCDYSAG